MLTEIYIEAFLVDKESADQVWEAWDAGEIGEVNAWWAWLWVVGTNISAVAYSCPSDFFVKLMEGFPTPNFHHHLGHLSKPLLTSLQKLRRGQQNFPAMIISRSF